jgi:UDP-N-acetyl-D-mannosaminuronate dehydrogenase
MNTNFKQICFMGMGYIGLPTAAVSAGKGLKDSWSGC